MQLADGAAIAGIGINVNHRELPPELEATSLRLHANREFPREEIIRALLHSIPVFLSEDNETILRLFTHASSYATGRRVVVHQPGGMVEGVDGGPRFRRLSHRAKEDDGTDTLILAGGVRAAGS